MSAQFRYSDIQTSQLSRRTFLRLAATGATGALLAACTLPAPQTDTGQASPGAAERTQVSVFESCWDAPHIDAGEELYVQFQNENPDIAVTAFWPAAGSDWATELLAKVAAGEQIDVIWWCSSHHKFAEEGRLLDLRDLVENDPDFSFDDFQQVGVDFSYDQPGRGGALWGVPTNYATILLWYNMNMFDNAGVAYPDPTWTYTDLLEAAIQLTKDTNGDGTPEEWGFSIPDGSWYIEPVIEAFGGGMVDVDSDQPCMLNQPASVEALQWLQDLFFTHKVSPTPADMAGMGASAMLISNKLAMGFWPEWGQREFLSSHDDVGLNYGVTLIPEGPAGRVTNYWAGITSVTSTVSDPDAAWQVVKFITGDTYQRMMTVTLPESPSARIETARYGFEEAESYPDDRSALLESPQYGNQYYGVARYGKEMLDIVDPSLDPVWEGAMAPDAVVDEICANVETKVAELKATAGSSSMGICIDCV